MQPGQMSKHNAENKELISVQQVKEPLQASYLVELSLTEPDIEQSHPTGKR